MRKKYVYEHSEKSGCFQWKMNCDSMDVVADGLEMTIVNQRVNKLLNFYENRRTNTAITRACS
jgi:hypothetical protein